MRKSDEMETIVSGVLFAIDNIADECFTWVPPDARWRRPRAYIYVYYLCVYIYRYIYPVPVPLCLLSTDKN